MSSLLRVVLLLVLAAFAAPVFAQPAQKAYAPEDLRRLAVPDRIRVLEREYADQSGGERLPDDQLEFYLDQIESGWGFSRVKQDIAESLGGGGWEPSTPGWTADEVICSSEGRRYTECRTPFDGAAELSQQISDTACIEGQTWGQRRGLIWVDRGCRGRFREGRWGGSPGFNPGGGAIVCESREGKRRRCATPFRGPAVISEQLSNAPCIEGDTWAQVPGEIWVSRGCRAVFVEGRGGLPGGGHSPGYGGGYSVTCNSEGERYRTCAWDRRQGRPDLVEQISRTPCIEGRTWGWDGSQLWVDQGCRGRFAAR